MAQKKKTNQKTKANKPNTNTSKKGTSKQATESKSSFLKDEITIFIALAICILLMISHFGVGGVLGSVVSNLMFGLFGTLAYVIPIVAFIGIAFVVSNKGNVLAYIKLIGCVLVTIMLCTLFQLIMYEYMPGTKIFEYYKMSQEFKDGGGLLGGIMVSLLCPAIGTIGTYVVAVIVLIIAYVLITEKSVIGGVKKGSAKAYEVAKRDAEKHREARVRAKEMKQLQIEEKRKDRVVSGVSFDTTIAKETAPAKKSPDVHEITVPQIEEKVEPLPMEELFHAEPSGQLVINRAEPIVEEVFPEEVVPEIPEKKVRTRQKTKESRKEVETETIQVEAEIQEKEEKEKKVYEFPPLSLLQKGKHGGGDSDEHLRATALKLEQTLQNFNVNVTVTNVSCGPSVTRYELQPEQGVKVSKIVGLADDIKLNLAASDIRIEAPIPGKAAVGIEVPNKENSAVMLRDLLESAEFKNHASKIAFATGRDIAGQTVVADIAKMPHVLIAGATGSGKSVCINTLIMSILYKASPDEVKLIMIDPKVVELSVYNGIPHLLIPVVTDPKKAAGALNWAVAEMTRRYQFFAECNVRDLKGYNAKVEAIAHIEGENKREKLPQIVVIVDELADLMMVAPGEVEEAICRLAQLARAAGIHLVLATQRPSVNVITGLIKANMPSRIAFAVSSGVDSRTIIDMNGAEKLLGKGDMLFYPAGLAKPIRVQGSFVSDKEVQSVVDFLLSNGEGANYNEEITNHMNSAGAAAGAASMGGAVADDKDAYFVEAGKFVIDKDKASIGMLQRVFKIGFNRAARIMDQLCEAGVVGEEEGTKPRKVLMSMEQFEQYIDEYL